MSPTKLPLRRRTARLTALVVLVAGTVIAYSANAAGEPAIIAQPQSQTVSVGGTVSLTVTATGSPAPKYQWRKDATNISGATRSSYSKTNVQAADAGTYTVYISNNKGNVTSNGAVLTVNPSAAPFAVDLWPGAPPGDVGIDGEERSFIYDSELTGPTKLVTDVSKPTLTVYLPPREKNTRTAMVICPGGGFHSLFWELEGEEVAAWLNSIGITGIILKYRVPRRAGDLPGEPPLGPLHDAQRAVSLVRSRAVEWDIDPTRIGMVGFSVGGHLSLATATSFGQRTYARIDAVDDVSCRPDFAALCYPGIWPGLRMPTTTPPILLAHASDDTVASSEMSATTYLELKRSGISAELHIYASGEHDFGVRQNGKLPSTWTQLSVFWLRSLNLLTAE